MSAPLAVFWQQPDFIRACYILAVSLFATDDSTGGNLAAIQYQMIRAGRRDAAERAGKRLATLAKEIVAGLGVPGVKHAVDLAGLTGGAPRLPLLPLDAAAKAHVAAVLAGEVAPASAAS